MMKREEKKTNLPEWQQHNDSWLGYDHCEENYESEDLEEGFYRFSALENTDSERNGRE